MIIWNRTLSVAATLALLLAAIAVACDGGDGREQLSSLEDYFQWLEQLHGYTQQSMDALDRKLDETMAAASTDNGRIDALRERYGAAVAVYRHLVDTVEDSYPPIEARKAHNEFAASLAAELEILENWESRLVDVRSTVELAVWEAELKLNMDPAVGRVNRACAALQKIADDHNIDVNLKCADGGQQEATGGLPRPTHATFARRSASMRTS